MSEPGPPNERLLTRQEAATMLSCSIDTIARLYKQGEVPIVYLGRDIRIPLSALNALIERGGTRLIK